MDIIKAKIEEKYDLTLCLNVLEHIFEFQKAVNNIHKALVKVSDVFIAIPCMYPPHMIPNDYFRYLECALRKIFKKFIEKD